MAVPEAVALARQGIEAVYQALMTSPEVALAVCCGSGTHRSVALIEFMSKELQRMGIRVKKKHLHRRPQPGDPW